MCCGTEAGSYLRLIDSCITQLKDQGPSRTCNERKEEEEELTEARSFCAARSSPRCVSTCNTTHLQNKSTIPVFLVTYLSCPRRARI